MTGATRRAHDRPLEPAAPRRGARPARLGARRGGEAPGRARPARSSHAHLREVAQGRRADPPLHRRAARRRLAPLALPRRLHRAAAARDRAAARRRRAARRLGDERARARDRRRPARRRDLRRLPGTVASLRQQWGRAGRRTGSLCSSRARTRSTSTSCASPTSCSAAGSRRRFSTTRIRGCRRARPRSRIRSSDRRARHSAPRAEALPQPRSELKSHATRLRLGRQGLPAARTPLRIGRHRGVHDHRGRNRRPPWRHRKRPRLHNRPRRRRLPPRR